MAKVTFKGTPVELYGDFVSVGVKVPDFLLVDKALNEVTLESLGAHKKIISVVPSLDTGVCQLSTQKLNQFAQDHPTINVVVVSADLPFAQSRFCDTSALENVTTLSMMRGKEFAKAYGVLMVNGALAGLAARAVIALDETNQVIYTELVAEIGQEPNYDALFAVL